MLIQLPHIEPIEVPEKYEDLTLTQLTGLIDSDDTAAGMLKVLTGIDYDFKYINDQQLNNLANCLALLIHPVELTGKPNVPDLETKTFVDVYAFELAAVEKYTNIGMHYTKMLNTLSIKSEGFKLSKAIPMAQMYLDQLNHLNETWSKQMPGSTTSEEIRAGVDKFNYFGRWGTVYRLAGSDLTKIEKVWKMPYREVYQACLYNYTQSNFEKRLNEIHSKK